MATKPLPADYFTTGVFAPAGAELLRAYTCVGCGHRSATWTAFRAHGAACPRPGARTDETEAAVPRPPRA